MQRSSPPKAVRRLGVIGSSKFRTVSSTLIAMGCHAVSMRIVPEYFPAFASAGTSISTKISCAPHREVEQQNTSYDDSLNNAIHIPLSSFDLRLRCISTTSEARRPRRVRREHSLHRRAKGRDGDAHRRRL